MELGGRHMVPQLKSEMIYQALKRDFANGTYKLGDKLPKELDLSKQMGVAPGTLRVVLKRLEAENLIARIPSKGTFVKSLEVASSPPADSASPVVKNKILVAIQSFKGDLNTSDMFHRELILGVIQEVVVNGYTFAFCAPDEVDRLFCDDVGPPGAGLLRYDLCVCGSGDSSGLHQPYCR